MLKFTTELSQAQLGDELRNLGFRTARELYEQYGEDFRNALATYYANRVLDLEERNEVLNLDLESLIKHFYYLQLDKRLYLPCTNFRLDDNNVANRELSVSQTDEFTREFIWLINILPHDGEIDTFFNTNSSIYCDSDEADSFAYNFAKLGSLGKVMH